MRQTLQNRFFTIFLMPLLALCLSEAWAWCEYVQIKQKDLIIIYIYSKFKPSSSLVPSPFDVRYWKLAMYLVYAETLLVALWKQYGNFTELCGHITVKWVLMLRIYCRRIQAWRSKEIYYCLPTVTENLYLLPHLFLSKILFELQHTKCTLTKCNANTFCCVQQHFKV